MSISSDKYKQMSIKEFTKAAKIYDSGKSGIYEMCKYDYPKVLKELKNKKFNDVLDCGCGTGPMIEILCEKYSDKQYTGLDLTPEMIKKAKEKFGDDLNITLVPVNPTAGSHCGPSSAGVCFHAIHR